MFDGLIAIAVGSFIKCLVVVPLLTMRKFDFLRVAYTWPLIAIAGYWGITLAAGFAFIMVPESLRQTLLIPILLLALLALAMLDAGTIFELAGSDFYRDSEHKISKRFAWGVSIAGNVVPLLVLGLVAGVRAT